MAQGDLVVQVGDAQTNTEWLTLHGMISCKVVRGSHAAPGTFDLRVTVQDEDSAVDFRPASVTVANRYVAFDPGEDDATFHAMSEDGTSDYAVTRSDPSVVVKIDPRDPMSRLGSLTLDPGESMAEAVAIDGVGVYGYVAVPLVVPAIGPRIVKFRCSDMTRVAEAFIPQGTRVTFMVASEAGDHLYAASDAGVFHLDSSGAGLSFLGGWVADIGSFPVAMRGFEDFLVVACAQPTIRTGFARFGVFGRLRVVKLQLGGGALASPTEVSSTEMDVSDDSPHSIDISPAGHAYVLCQPRDGASAARVVVVDIAATAPTRLSHIDLPVGGYGEAYSLDYAPEDGYLYVLFGSPITVMRLDVSQDTPRRIGDSRSMLWIDGRGLQVRDGSAYVSTGSSPAALVKLDLSGISDVITQSAARARFYPFLNVRVLENNGEVDITDPNCRQYFIGRIDTASIVEDTRYGRVWQISCRDRLACLSDNFIGLGAWFHIPQGRGLRSGIIEGSVYVPKYTGNWSNDPSGVTGERRQSIVSDLALNIIASDDLGLTSVDFSNAPNSRRIEKDWSGTNDSEILAAIREIAAHDPWFDPEADGAPSLSLPDPGDREGGSVDAQFLQQNGFPPGSGFGGEFQIICNTADDDGKHAEYFRRGFLKSNGAPEGLGRGGFNYVLSYGAPQGVGVADLSVVRFITAYRFDKQGLDLFSRVNVQGRGEATSGVQGSVGQTLLSPGTDQTTVPLPEMEQSWLPESGWFKVRRTIPVGSAGIVGEPEQSGQADGNDATNAREATDVAYGSFASLGTGKGGAHVGMNRGTIAVAGLPNGAPGQVLRPGTAIDVYIPQVGVVDTDNPFSQGQEFVIESWTLIWPDNTTTFEIGRIGFSDVGARLIDLVTKTQTNSGKMNSRYDTGWFFAPSDGKVEVTHGLGVKPKIVGIIVALWDGGFSPDGSPRPVSATVVHVSGMAFDFQSGQYSGANISKSDRQSVAFQLAPWIAYSDGAGQYLRLGDTVKQPIIRVIAQP
jgi:hypothetical protein